MESSPLALGTPTRPPSTSVSPSCPGFFRLLFSRFSEMTSLNYYLMISVWELSRIYSKKPESVWTPPGKKPVKEIMSARGMKQRNKTERTVMALKARESIHFV